MKTCVGSATALGTRRHVPIRTLPETPPWPCSHQPCVSGPDPDLQFVPPAEHVLVAVWSCYIRSVHLQILIHCATSGSRMSLDYRPMLRQANQALFAARHQIELKSDLDFRHIRPFLTSLLGREGLRPVWAPVKTTSVPPRPDLALPREQIRGYRILLGGKVGPRQEGSAPNVDK